MWEDIKNSPLLRTIAIAILGVLGFGFAFNIMFGSSGEGMGHETSGGNSLDNTLAYTLAILIKVLLITLVITAIIAVIKYSRKYLVGYNQSTSSNNNKLIDYIKADPVLKTVTIIVAAFLLLGVLAVVSKSIFGYNAAFVMKQGGLNYGFGLTGILIFLVRLLLTLSVIGLVVGAIAILIQNKSKFSFDVAQYFKSERTKDESCKKCGFDLKPDWQCCPKCGEDLEKKASGQHSI